MIVKILFFLLFIIILIIWLFSYKMEPFISISSFEAKHIRLNKFGRIDSKTFFPPHPREGESRCIVTVCPSWIPETAICYKCE